MPEKKTLGAERHLYLKVKDTCDRWECRRDSGSIRRIKETVGRTIGGEIAQGSKVSKKRAENDERVL